MTDSKSPPDSGEISERDRKGRFLKGSPATGRKSGSKNRIPANIRGLVAENAEEIVQAMIAKARGGNAHAGSALLRLVCAPLREQADPIEIDLKAIGTVDEAAAAMAVVISAATSGKISPDAARDLVGMIGALSKAYEVVDLERRLAAIEDTIKKSTA